MKENDHINKCNVKIEKQIEDKMSPTIPAHTACRTHQSQKQIATQTPHQQSRKTKRT